MYANRYDGSRASRPVSAGAALLVNGALMMGLVLAVPTIVKGPEETTLWTSNVPITPPPEPIDDKSVELKKAVTATTPPLQRSDPLVKTVPSGPTLDSVRDPVVPSFDPPVGPSGAGTVVMDPPATPPPVLVSAEIDSRYAASFQPDYPGSELRQEKEGVVKVRVLIGVDGRIKAVEQVSSPTPGFFDATRRHALAKWRFRPATRDGIPVESWKVMTVRFQITS
jgi:protein TonB